jgi:hypothetical protein
MIAPHALKFALLKYAQKSNLGLRWELTDFIKEKSSSVGGLKSSYTSL